ncbi:MAG: hypothetical protein K6C14_05425 [Eubacterium sp.]|nr:hypothetical protein [Eubacterium sp.]
MKKIIALVLCFGIVITFAACSANENKENNKSDSVSQSDVQNNGSDTEYSTQAAAYKSSGKSSGNSFESVLDTNEYSMYYNIFYNKMGGDYENKPVFKKGTFATLYDEYSHITRYYVWGYNDRTKCCDWQWELKPDDSSDLPANGSLIEVTGTFTKSDDSLDGYWIIEPKIKVLKEYTPPEVDIDMSTMSATLERVQCYYIGNKAPELEGKTVCTYGRVKTASSIQHPYYNEAYEIPVETGDEMPAIGMMVLVTGTVKDGKIVNAKVSVTEDY